jgi:hypothetical protein
MSDHLGASKPPTDKHDFVLVDAVKLVYRLGCIHADADGLFTVLPSHLAVTLKRHQAV